MLLTGHVLHMCGHSFGSSHYQDKRVTNWVLECIVNEKYLVL